MPDLPAYRSSDQFGGGYELTSTVELEMLATRRLGLRLEPQVTRARDATAASGTPLGAIQFDFVFARFSAVKVRHGFREDRFWHGRPFGDRFLLGHRLHWHQAEPNADAQRSDHLCSVRH